MIRLSALNDYSSDESEPERTQESIKQAQEAEALELYNKALGFQHAEEYTKAEQTYQQLLVSPFVKEAPAPDPEEEGLHHPGQVLKYSAYKNLAILAENRGEYEKASDAYLEAVTMDNSDVSVWYRIGKVSMKCYNLTLARQALEEGLRCNSKHWPCLDKLCTVLYSIGDYATCLVMICDALEEDDTYLKGMALRDKIFKEEPYLRREYKHLRSLFVSFIDEEDTVKASEYVKEALLLREERLNVIEASKADPLPVSPIKPLTSYTWAALGDCFVVLYDHMTSPDNSESLGLVVNLDDYYKAIVTPDISMPHKASLGKMSDNLAGSSFSTEGFGVYKSAGSSDNDEKVKKTAKRKKPPTNSLENDFPPKRRSARVRTSKKKEEETNYKDLIQSFLPFPLRTIALADDESSQDSLSESLLNNQIQSAILDGKILEKSGQSSEYDVISGEAETLDVLTFVKEHMDNGGVIDLMIKFGICLAAQRNKKWPPALADIFIKVYSRLRKHVVLPSEFIRDQDEVYTGELAKLILVATELTLDKLLTAKSKSSSSLSPASSPRGGPSGVSPISAGLGFSSKFLANDIEYLHCIALDRTIHGDSWLEVAIRVNWAKARYLMLQGQMEIAMLYLDRCTKLLAVEVSPLSEPMTVKLVNCKIDNNVTLENVHKKLESLQRCQSLEEVHRLYEMGQYEDVVQLLIPTLYQPQPKTKASELGMSIPERPAQLLLLQDSLIKLRDFRKCLECTEVALNEAVSQMSPCEAWSTTLARLFQCMNICIEESKTILDGFPQAKLQSLTLNIIKVIEASIYSSDVSMEPPLATAYPWVLLYKIIKNKEIDEEMEIDMPEKLTTPIQTTSDGVTPEEAETVQSNDDAVNTSSDTPTLPASLKFLRTAHDQLGRRGWCCNNDGIFLLLCVEVLTELLTKPLMSTREDIIRDLEQCFLCLYGHPSKKAKLRGLQEHNSCQIPLTWQNSAVVFDYFKPPQLPMFDAKTNTISAEVQNLMRRITLIVPQHELEAISFDNVQAYIDGISDEVPKLPEGLSTAKRPVVGELFYLLADFYFKNKEFSKALKFYTHDICVKPNRSDSWAAMSLIRKSRLESKLNACEPKSAGPIQKHAVAALRCFKRAMETDSTNSSILEEYGSLCYFLHSHASRQLKQFDQEEVSVETRSSLLQRKEEMLHLSEKIFSIALGMDDSEAWLHHYMLGKIAEKLKKSPHVYLEHYAKSARFLDDDISSYPRKIPFYSPPEHVLEALEVYYRIHLSVLKLLLNDFHNIDRAVLEKHLQHAGNGPFFQPEYDVDAGHAVLLRSESITSEMNAEPAKELSGSSGKNQDTMVSTPELLSTTSPTSAPQENTQDKTESVANKEETKSTIDNIEAMIGIDSDHAAQVVSGLPSQEQAHRDDETVTGEGERNKIPSTKETSSVDNKKEEKAKSECVSSDLETNVNNSLKLEKMDDQSFQGEGNIKMDKDTSSPFKIGNNEKGEMSEDNKLLVDEYQQSRDRKESKETNTENKEECRIETVDVNEAKVGDDPSSTTKSLHSEKVLEKESCEDKPNSPKSLVATVDGSEQAGMLTDSSVLLEEKCIERTRDVEIAKQVVSLGTEAFKVQEEDIDEEKPTPMDTEDLYSSNAYSTELLQSSNASVETQEQNSAKPSSASQGTLDELQLSPEHEQTKGNDANSSTSVDIPSSIKDNVTTITSQEQIETPIAQAQDTIASCMHNTKLQPSPSQSTGEMHKPTSSEVTQASSSSVKLTADGPATKDLTIDINKDSVKLTADGPATKDLTIDINKDKTEEVCKENISTEVANKNIDTLSTKPMNVSLTEAQKETHRELIDLCIHGLEHCLLRFPQHHKSRYRLAYVNYVSPYHKDVQLSRALLLGGNHCKTKLSRNPQQGLFNEKSKTNMFSAFWRIPEEDIDRPGSFCTHTYKSVDLLLQVLKDLNEWDSLLSISNLLHRTPEAGKKYLRDNERHYLARKACDFTVNIMSKRTLDPQSDPETLRQLVVDVYECWKISQKYELSAKVSENLLIKSFEMYQTKNPDSPVTPSSNEAQPSILERALRFCQQIARPQTSSVSVAPQTPADSSLDSQTDVTYVIDDVIVPENNADVIKTPMVTDLHETDSPTDGKSVGESSKDLSKARNERTANSKDAFSSILEDNKEVMSVSKDPSTNTNTCADTDMSSEDTSTIKRSKDQSRTEVVEPVNFPERDRVFSEESPKPSEIKEKSQVADSNKRCQFTGMPTQVVASQENEFLTVKEEIQDIADACTLASQSSIEVSENKHVTEDTINPRISKEDISSDTSSLEPSNDIPKPQE